MEKTLLDFNRRSVSIRKDDVKDDIENMIQEVLDNQKE